MSLKLDRAHLLATAERVYQYMIAKHSGSSELLNKFDANPTSWGTDIEDWEWNPGVGIIAISDYYDCCQRQDVLDYLVAWIERNKHKAGRFQNVNRMVPFAIFPAMYRRTGNRYYLDTAVDYGDWIVKQAVRTRNGAFQHAGQLTEEVWADTIFMVVLFLARLARLTGDKAMAQEAVQQLLVHLQSLQDPETGVLFHGFFCSGNHHKSGARWTRGNAWLVIGTPLILAEVADLVPVPAELPQRYARMVAGLLRYQAPNGLWHTVMDHPEFYQETSGTAGIACGILQAVRQGLLDASCLPAAERATGGVLSMIKPDGEVAGVSGGTPIMETIEAYGGLSCYPTLYGQGLTLMLLSEHARTR